MDQSSKQSANSNHQEVQVNVPANLRAPVYANTVNVNTSDSEITINFIYINHNDNPAGTLVSRVAVPRSMLGNMVDLFVQVAEMAGRGDKK